jgi:hypothetical protein
MFKTSLRGTDSTYRLLLKEEFARSWPRFKDQNRIRILASVFKERKSC